MTRESYRCISKALLVYAHNKEDFMFVEILVSLIIGMTHTSQQLIKIWLNSTRVHTRKSRVLETSARHPIKAWHYS